MSSVRLLFPIPLFEFNLLEEGLVSEEYLQSLKADMDRQRRKDPVGRKISNAYTGWQSNDGVERIPVWGKLMRIIKDKYNHEVLPWMGVTQASVVIGNAWGNINDRGAWNKPHRHNGCWMSGSFYVHADGDEGNFVAVNKSENVVSEFPHNGKERDMHPVSPITGTLLLFPSGLLHMVEPNMTDKDRYSVAFNTETYRYSSDPHATFAPCDNDWNKFSLDDPKVKG
tara:strand:- start:53 stop:730 length:678 start_codon:yes stop_codon:yes gene_type:complete